MAAMWTPTLAPELFGRIAAGTLHVMAERPPGGADEPLRAAGREALEALRALAQAGGPQFAALQAEARRLRGPDGALSAAELALDDALKGRTEPPALAADAVAWIASLVSGCPVIALDGARCAEPLRLTAPEPGERARLDGVAHPLDCPAVLRDARGVVCDTARAYDPAPAGPATTHFAFVLFAPATGERLTRALALTADLAARHLRAVPRPPIIAGL